MENIEPRKIRDFGEIINDTFVFIIQTWKPLLRSYFTICGFFIIGSAIASLLQQFKMMKAIQNIGPGSGVNPFGALSNLFGFEYFLTLLFSLLMYTTITLTTLAFIHLYKEKGNEAPDTEEVWTYVKFYFFRFLGSGIVLTALMMIGFMLCIIPGIYLWPVIALMFPIMMMENTTLGYAFSKSFKLMKDNWWPTFGVQFIMLIIVVAASFIFIIPLSIAGIGGFFLGIGKANTLGVVLQVIISQITMIFLVFPNIAIALSYYSLSEQSEGTGLIDRINEFGKKDPENPDLSPEEY